MTHPRYIPSDDRIGQYLAGELSPELAAEVRAYLERHPGRRGVMAGVAAAAHGDDMAARPSIDAAHARLMTRLDQLGRTADATDQPALYRLNGLRSRWISLGVATSLLIALIGLGVRWERSTTRMMSARVYATGAGQRMTITLADRTRITLAPRTSLTVAAGFGDANRDVALSGRAYFEVDHTNGHPFVVHTEHVTTRVLGTAFDVTHYADDPDVRVIVSTGKVAMTSPTHRAVVLVPVMTGHVTDSTALVMSGSDLATSRAWTRGILEFHDTPTADVLRAVSQWYGIRFELADTTLAAQRVTTFLNYTNTADVLVTLETVLNVTASSVTTPHGQVVTLRPKRPAVSPNRRRTNRSEIFSPNTEVGR